MKKILIVIISILWGVLVTAQTGAGWQQQRSKTNFRDSTYFVKGLSSGANLILGTNSITMTGSLAATGSRVLKGWFTDLEITNLPTINGGTLKAGLGFTTVGNSFVTLTNPSAITFPRINADNTVTALSASAFTTAIGAGHVYSDTMSVSAGVLRTKATTITTEPYSIQIFTSGGSDITHAVSDSIALDGGVYKLYVYSVDAITGAKIKILY